MMIFELIAGYQSTNTPSKTALRASGKSDELATILSSIRPSTLPFKEREKLFNSISFLNCSAF